jgi:uncharacterized protein (TIGR02679 family)
VSHARFDRPDLAVLWRAARQRFEEADRPVTRLTLRGLDDAERTALADLLGLAHLPDEDFAVPLRRLDAVLVAATNGLDTRAVVTAIGGPIVDRAALRRRWEEERRELWTWLEQHPIVTAEPALQTWAANVRLNGKVAGSVAASRELLENALRVLAELPTDDVLPVLAERTTGHTHALDEGTRLGSYVLLALATLHGVGVPSDAESRRRLWAMAGVSCDEISTVVIVAGLRPAGDDAVAMSLRAFADAGLAASVTLAQLNAHPVKVRAPAVHVVENPAVLTTALRRFGAACPPMVCSSGWPNTAVVRLLRQVAAGGAELRYHGDFDGDGVRIAAHVMAKTAALPWRLSVGDYLAACPERGQPVGRMTEAPWDPDLAPAMREHGVAVPEERVAGTLLDDLSETSLASEL